MHTREFYSTQDGLRNNFFLVSASYSCIVLLKYAIFSSAYSYCISARFQVLPH